jgi:hypothetical protein
LSGRRELTIRCALVNRSMNWGLHVAYDSDDASRQVTAKADLIAVVM